MESYFDEDRKISLWAPGPSTMLSLCMSGNPNNCIPMGRLVNVVGDSSAGKSFFCLSLLACAAADPRFDDYYLAYDDAERACSFDFQKLFGVKACERILPPINDDSEDSSSESIQDFESNLYRLIRQEKKFIYVLDSLDSLFEDSEREKDEANALKRDDDQKETGSYGMAKAKKMSSLLRNIRSELARLDSTVIIVSQVRDKIDPMAKIKKYRSGGKALEFYCSFVLWLTHIEHLKRGSSKLKVGTETKFEVTKNKATGKRRDCLIPIYYDYGLDDIGSCIDWMVDNDYWHKSGQTIRNFEAWSPMTREKLIEAIESNNAEDEMKAVVGQAWNEEEAKVKLDRKPRF